MLHLLAEASTQPLISDTIGWVATGGTFSTIGVLLYAWTQEYRAHRADGARKDAEIKRLNDAALTAQEQMLPMLTRAVDALQDVLVEKRAGR